MRRSVGRILCASFIYRYNFVFGYGSWNMFWKLVGESKYIIEHVHALDTLVHFCELYD